MRAILNAGTRTNRLWGLGASRPPSIKVPATSYLQSGMHRGNANELMPETSKESLGSKLSDRSSTDGRVVRRGEIAANKAGNEIERFCLRDCGVADHFSLGNISWNRLRCNAKWTRRKNASRDRALSTNSHNKYHVFVFSLLFSL